MVTSLTLLCLDLVNQTTNREKIMNRDEWDKTYTEQNAKAEMFGAYIAGLLMLVPVLGLLALWYPKVLYAVPLLIILIMQKRPSSKKKR